MSVRLQMNVEGVLTRLPVKAPCDGVAKSRTTGSFDCVVVRFANDPFAQDDTLK